ncbi:MAG: LacI family DNA-binding transcriptional regulator [Chloroflexota bacterium]
MPLCSIFKIEASNMVTIKYVAQHAGVSKATVSRVLNGNLNVNAEMRQRVLASIATLDYQPSALAGSLRRQRTRAIGLVVPDNRNPFFAELARGIEARCDEAGYSVYLCNSADSEQKEIDYCYKLYRQRVAGVAIAITGTSEQAIRYLQTNQMPIVLLDRGYPGVEADSVQCDHYQGAYDAMDYLLGLGHRRFGLIIGLRHDPPVQDRLRATFDILHKHGLDIDHQMIYETQNYGHEAGYTGAQHLLSIRQRPTAIFAFNDSMAVGALRYALESGLRVPGDLSVIGVDNIPLSSFVYPSLTTVAQPMTEIGRAAADMLLARIEGTPASYIRKHLPAQLIVRESTGSPNG